MQRIPGIYFAPSEISGRGVFTAMDIEAGTLIEICPVLVLPKKELSVIHNTSLHDYYFLWGAEQDRAAIALGYASLYNHSYSANAFFNMNLDDDTLLFIAAENIEAGSEVLVNYNGDQNDTTLVWFDKKEQKELK